MNYQVHKFNPGILGAEKCKTNKKALFGCTVCLCLTENQRGSRGTRKILCTSEEMNWDGQDRFVAFAFCHSFEQKYLKL